MNGVQKSLNTKGLNLMFGKWTQSHPSPKKKQPIQSNQYVRHANLIICLTIVQGCRMFESVCEYTFGQVLKFYDNFIFHIL